jgi:3-oxoadipate enol-lactonase
VPGAGDRPAGRRRASIAEELAGLLPGAELQVYDDDGVLWGHRAEVRTRISTFLNHP